MNLLGARSSVVVKALCYKLEGPGSTRNIKITMFLASKVPQMRKADILTAICEPIV
jgi:hypothetical protein